LVKADLEAAGMQVEVVTGDRATVDGLLREGDFDLALNGHGGIANPNILRTPSWPSEVYQNPAYDELFRQQAQTVDEAARREQVYRLQEIIAEDLPVLTLYHPLMWCLYDPEVLDTWFYTQGGISIGIPIELNKIVFFR
jgi:peptide/nickel transport system substrate-binding protein